MTGLILPFEMHRPQIAPDAWIAPDATVIGRVQIGPGSGIWYKCVLRGDVDQIVIGARSNIQDGTIIHVNSGQGGTYIGDEVTVGHQCLLHGCRLESGSFVGMRAAVMDNAVVETGAMVAAGALVPPGKRIPAGQLWAGSPAKFMRELRPEDMAVFTYTVNHYAELAGRHRRALASHAEEARLAGVGQ